MSEEPKGRAKRDARETKKPMTAVEFSAIRESIGSQEEVAKELYTARRTFGRWESGERPVPGIAAAAIELLAQAHRERQRRTREAIAALGDQKVMAA